MTRIVVPAVSSLFFLLAGVTTFSQTIAWTIVVPGPYTFPPTYVSGVDLDTAALQFWFYAPRSDVSVVSGTMSPDRQSYYVVTNQGIVRFNVATRTPAEFIPIVVGSFGGTVMSIAPSGRRWYFRGATGTPLPSYQIFDALSREELHRESGTLVSELTFSRDGRRRYELRHQRDDGTVTAYSLYAFEESTGAALWVASYPTDTWVGRLTVSDDGLYVAAAGPSGSDDVQIRRVSLSDGSVMSAVSLTALWGSDVIVGDVKALTDRIVVAAYRVTGDSPLRLIAAFDSLGLMVRSSTSVNADAFEGPGRLIVVDDTRGYFTFPSYPHRFTAQNVVMPMNFQTLEMSPPRSTPVMQSWDLEETRPPRPPQLTLRSLTGDRATIAWELATSGGAPTSITVVVAHASAAPIESGVSIEAREWTTPPLAPGPYRSYVVARRSTGVALSNEVRFSVGIAGGPPNSPAELTATARDTTVRLTWSVPDTGGSYPSGFLIEAAAAGSDVFVPVANTAGMVFEVPRVPIGDWQVRVRSFTADAVGSPSDTVSFTSSPCTAPPLAPADIAAVVTGRTVTLSWDPPDHGPGVEGYSVEAVVAPGPLNWITALAIGPSNVTSARTWPGVYGVRLRARNACGESSPSNEIVVTVP